MDDPMAEVEVTLLQLVTTPDLASCLFTHLDMATLAALHLTYRELALPSPQPELLHAVDQLLQQDADLALVQGRIRSRGAAKVALVEGCIRTMRGPCLVTGAATCHHGLCLKHVHCVAPGLVRLLQHMSDGGGDGEDNSSEQDARRCYALILLAKLAGRVRPGQLEQGYWLRAAQLGSAEAQLQCGLSGYHCLSGKNKGRTLPCNEHLERAAANERADAWTKATAHLYLGFMLLDAIGLEQDDEAATSHFARARRAAERGMATARDDEERETLRSLSLEAIDALKSLERFTFFANGRP